jgi:hypothetical protein
MNAPSRIGIDPPDALSQRVRAAVQAQRTMTLRPHLRNALALMIATSLTLAVVAAASQIVYGDQALGLQAGIRSPSLLAAVAIALLALLLASTCAALWRGRSGFGASTATLTATALTTAPLYALLALSVPVHQDLTAVGSVIISAWGARCLVIALLVGVVVLGCFAAAMRAAAPVGTRLRSMVLGSAAGAWAGLAVFVFCPSAGVLHLSIGHVLPVVALSILGAVALPALLRP